MSSTFRPGELNFNRANVARWGTSVALVLALHAGLFAIAVYHHVHVQPQMMTEPVLAIDLPPEPQPAPAPPVPPPPQPQPQVTPPPEPVPKPVVKPIVRPVVKPVERPPVAEPMPAPPVVDSPPVTQPTPPVSAPPAPVRPVPSPMAMPNWQSQLLGRLEQYKRYPRVAQEHHQEGIVMLRFAMNREGKVLSFSLEKTSGFSLLDDEVLALIQRAQPLPPPPADIAGDHIELVVPVRFFLH